MVSSKSKATPRSARPTPKKVSAPMDVSDEEMEETPQTEPRKTPKEKAGRSTKRKRVDRDEVEGGDTEDETPVRSVSVGLNVAAAKAMTAKLTDHFGVEESWAGYQIYREMDKGMKKMMQKMVWIWVTIGSVMEFSGKFGPLAAYSPSSTLGISNLFIQQFGVRPDYCHRYPSPGKTNLFLLNMTVEMAERLLKIPKGWIKLAHGLGCRIRTLNEDPISSVAVCISNLLPIVSDNELSASLKAIPGVESVIGGFERTVLENNVATDRVACSLALKSDEALPFDVYDEKFEHLIKVGGMTVRVERRAACLVCGEDTHLQHACPTKQRLVSTEMYTWSFISDSALKPKLEVSGAEAPTKKAKKAKRAKGEGKESAPVVEAKKPGKGSSDKKTG